MGIYFGNTKIASLNLVDNSSSNQFANVNYYEFDSPSTYGMFLFENPFEGEEINVEFSYDFYLISEKSKFDTSNSLRTEGKISVCVGTKLQTQHNDTSGIENWVIEDKIIYYRQKYSLSGTASFTSSKKYLQVGNWIKEINAKYYIMNLSVTINGIKVSPYDVYVFDDRGIAEIKSCFDISQRIVKPVTKKYEGKLNVCFGDSITYGSGYYNLLGGIFNTAGSQGICYNGWRVAGDTIDGGAICNKLTELSDIEANDKNGNKIGLITMLMGVNDFNTSRELGTIESTEQTTFYGALHKVCSYVVTNFPDATFVMATPLHCNLSPFVDPNSKNDLDLKLIDYCNAIKDVCIYYDIPCLDAHYTSGYIPHIEWNKTKYTSDGLHPNENGKHLITKLWADFIDNLAE